MKSEAASPLRWTPCARYFYLCFSSTIVIVFSLQHFLFAIFSFHLFSFLSFPKLTPASCHATCEFYLKKSDACEILDFSDITRLRKLRPGLFNSLRARYSGSPVRVLLFCFSLFVCIFLQYSR